LEIKKNKKKCGKNGEGWKWDEMEVVGGSGNWERMGWMEEIVLIYYKLVCMLYLGFYGFFYQFWKNVSRETFCSTTIYFHVSFCKYIQIFTHKKMSVVLTHWFT
jgi:hypothetical protein